MRSDTLALISLLTAVPLLGVGQVNPLPFGKRVISLASTGHAVDEAAEEGRDRHTSAFCDLAQLRLLNRGQSEGLPGRSLGFFFGIVRGGLTISTGGLDAGD